MKNLLKNPALYICILAVTFASLFLLIWEGDILLNSPSEERFPVRGADVSAWQGDIDWQAFAAEDIDFVFIKATEGSSHTDGKFRYNFEKAQENGLLTGAYHFFSYDSSGTAQAQHFIETVPVSKGTLPPVIDVEFYGDKEKHLPEKADVRRELSDMITLLTEHYGKAPIIYATQKSYDLYIAHDFPQCPIWIREVMPCTEPVLSDGRQWIFWQYTNRYKADGLSGGVKFVDMNVFSGDLQKLRALCGGFS